MKSNGMSRRGFVTTAAAVVTAAVLPDKLFAAPQDPVVNTLQKSGKTVSYEKVPWKVWPFPSKQVTLGDGPLLQAREANRRFLISLPPDRLLHTFRINAGLNSSAEPLGGWEAPDCELRGHFAGGHYLSAVGLAYAATGDEELRKRGDSVVTGLGQCQKNLQNGYLSAFPIEFFDRLRERIRVWAPFYTIHKIMAGLLDMYVHTGNTQALEIAEGMAKWVKLYTQPLSYNHMQRVLGTEFGGMGEIFANLYAVTGKEDYLEVGQRFDHKQFFDPLAAHRDELRGLHVNTQIPKVIGAARYYELTQENRYRAIADYFWNEVVSERSYCTGGTSNGEIWNTDPGVLSTELSPSTTECCCAYNMMKLTRHVFGWNPDARLMDYYERVMFNHRLGTINPEDGATMYYLPLVSGYWKVFGKPFEALWCCTGTGAEEYAKLTDTIYFHDDDSVYVNLYVQSELEWPEKGIRLKQETRFPEQQGAAFIVKSSNPVDLTLRFRIPYWVRGGGVKVNGVPLAAFSSPGSYLAISRQWKNGDRVEISLPMDLHIHAMPDDGAMQAVMYGPLVLAGKFESVTKDMMYGEYEPRGEAYQVPKIVADPEKPTAWVGQGNEPLTFKAAGQEKDFSMVPLYKVIQDRYAVYWNVRRKNG
ncbi:MAG TPA: beta-L-arabinofuranosidase domain-containing protein [Terriglobales bacterium]|nr:beta-L-arabinofuranosidase domain-containing protein [Terriglobales bacterium]